MKKKKTYHGLNKKPKPVLETKIRTCLKCQKEFESGGNRICPACTQKNTDSRFSKYKYKE